MNGIDGCPMGHGPEDIFELRTPSGRLAAGADTHYEQGPQVQGQDIEAAIGLWV